MAYVLVTDTDLTSVANEIRSKTGSSAQLAFPAGYVAAIRDMQKGTPKAAATYNPSSSDQVIAAGYYLEGAQTIKKVTASNLSAANVKAGVTVSVSGLSSVSGTFTNDANASAGTILSGYTAYVNGSKITGTIPSKSGETIDPRSGRRTLSAGYYLSGNQTIYGCTLVSSDTNYTFPSSATSVYSKNKVHIIATISSPGTLLVGISDNTSGNGSASRVYVKREGNNFVCLYQTDSDTTIPANRFKLVVRAYSIGVV